MDDSLSAMSQDVVAQGNQSSSEGHNLKVGGFPEELFDNLTDNEKETLSCNICLNVVNQCHKCSNGHLFCKSCIFVWTQVHTANSNRCPVCRTFQADYLPMLELDRQLLDKNVSCLIDDCKFSSTLQLFLFHVHGKSAYCSEQKDYDQFRAKCRKSNAEEQASENERLVELINFIERFNILQSMISFETLVRQPLSLQNLLQTSERSDERRSLEPDAPRTSNGFLLPLVSLDPSHAGFDRLPSASENRNVRHRSSLDAEGSLSEYFDIIANNSAFEDRSDLNYVGQPDPRYNARRRSLFPVPNTNSRPDSTSNVSLTFTHSSDNDSPLSFGDVTPQPDTDDDSDNEYCRSSLRQQKSSFERSQAGYNTILFSSPDPLRSSTSNDTLIDDQTVAGGSDDSIGLRSAVRRSRTNLRTLSDETKSSTSEWLEPLFDYSTRAEHLDSSCDEIDSFQSDSKSLVAFDSSLRFERPKESIASLAFAHPGMPPFRISGMPLATEARKTSKGSFGRRAPNPSPKNPFKKSCRSPDRMGATYRRHMDLNKPVQSSSKAGTTKAQLPDTFNETTKLNRVSGKTDTSATKSCSRRDFTHFRSSLLRGSGTQHSKEVPGIYEGRALKQSTHEKHGEPMKRLQAGSSGKVQSFKLPSIYPSLSSSKPIKSLKPPGVTQEAKDLTSRKANPRTRSFTSTERK